MNQPPKIAASKTAVFTIFSKNYLPYARVLMRSVRQHMPDVLRIGVLVDRLDGYFRVADEDFAIILSADLAIPASPWFHFKYTTTELNTAVKPFAAEAIFRQFGLEQLIYLDPDIRLYGPMTVVTDVLKSNNIALTPHLTTPITDSRRPGELDILRSGAYNLGFIGLKNGKETDSFLRWWQERLFDLCVVDLAKGLFVDQRWIDLIPGLFAGTSILRDSGLNVAYWNIAQRKLKRVEEHYEVDGPPLCFFHFSGFNPENPSEFSIHQDRFVLDELGDAKGLVLAYRKELIEQGYLKCKNWPYAFARFANGRVIPDMGRAVHHEEPEVMEMVADPFSDDGYAAFLKVWNTTLQAPAGEDSGITRLAYRIYRARPDVQAAMPDIFRADLRRYLEWMITSGTAEHRLDSVFVEPIRSGIVRLEQNNDHRPPTEPVVNERIMEAVGKSGEWRTDGLPVSVRTLVEAAGPDAVLTRLENVIYKARPDLQRRFPNPVGEDSLQYLGWLLTYGAREYRLAPELLVPAEARWVAELAETDNRWVRLGYRLARFALDNSWRIRNEWRARKFRLRSRSPLRALR